MPTDSDIEHFVRDTLGCTCPDEVFLDIRQQQLADDCLRIAVGGRLLVDIVDTDDKALTSGAIESMLANGVTAREASGYNRFRLVLLTDQQARIKDRIEQDFQHSAWCDERTHLHVLERKHKLA